MQPNSPLLPTNQPPAPDAAMLPTSEPVPTSTMDTGQVVATAKSLVMHYKQDPFRLSVELEQLKSAYLQSQYHITVNDTEH
jgi:hypothetical protein